MALRSTEIEYIRVKFNPIQLKIIQQISKLLFKLMNISNLAVRGIVWHALREWEIIHNKTIADMTKMPLSKSVVATKEIFTIAKRELKNMLNEPKEQNEILLDIIFEKAFKYYLEYINKIRQ